MALSVARILGRARAPRRNVLGFVGLCVVGLLLLGCGGAGTVSRASQVTAREPFHLASSACSEYNTEVYAERSVQRDQRHGGGPSRFLARRLALLSQLGAILEPLDARPDVHQYLAKLDTEAALLRALQSALRKGYSSYHALAVSPSFRRGLRRAQTEAAADARDVHLLACIGPGPRAPIRG